MTNAPPPESIPGSALAADASVDPALLESWFDLLYSMLPNPGAAIILSTGTKDRGEILLSRTKRNKAPAYFSTSPRRWSTLANR